MLMFAESIYPPQVVQKGGIREMMTNNISWLITTPATDGNFKSALSRATDEEIKEAISGLEGKSGIKTKLKVLESELRKRERR